MEMTLRVCTRVFSWIILFLAVSVSCSSEQSKTIPLASFTENDVSVSIILAQDSKGNSIVSATFTPPEGFHLYSKDIPVTGLNGLGRPTLLEMTSNSLMRPAGSLAESLKPEPPDFEPKELLVYPQGEVTLNLPVELPPGDEWHEDELAVTYMACSASLCKPPVVGKIVPVRIPGADVLESK